jgi:glutamate dehydrogenase/leucine dehydrogenase
MAVFIIRVKVLIHTLFGSIKNKKMGLMVLAIQKENTSIMKMLYTNNGIYYVIFSDIFIPAALQKTINMHNAHRFNCKLVVEGANGPTT